MRPCASVKDANASSTHLSAPATPRSIYASAQSAPLSPNDRVSVVKTEG